MLNKLNIFCWLVALTVMICGSFYVKYVTQKFDAVKSELQTYKIENKQLKENWEKEKENVLAASKRIKTLNDIIANSEDSKRWADNPLDKRLINELYNQYLSHKD